MYCLLEFTVGNYFKLFLCPFLYFGRLPSDRHGWYMNGGEVRVGKLGDSLLRLFRFVLPTTISYFGLPMQERSCFCRKSLLS
jgi:hypothetical protein